MAEYTQFPGLGRVIIISIVFITCNVTVGVPTAGVDDAFRLAGSDSGAGALRA